MAIPYWFEHIVPENMSKNDILNLKRRLNTLNLKPTAVSGHCELGQAEGAFQLEKRIQFTSCLGVNIIVIGSGAIKNKKEEINFYNAITLKIKKTSWIFIHP